MFFFPLELWCDKAWSCQSFLSFFLFFIQMWSLYSPPVSYCTTEAVGLLQKASQTWTGLVSRTHTGVLLTCVPSPCIFVVALDSRLLSTWPVRGQRQELCAAVEPFEKAHQAFIKSWKALAEAVKMCKDSSVLRVEDSSFLWRSLSCSSLFFLMYGPQQEGVGLFFTTFDNLEWKPVLIKALLKAFSCEFKGINNYNSITIETLLATSSQIFSGRLSVLLIVSDQIRFVHPDPNSSSAGLPW